MSGINDAQRFARRPGCPIRRPRQIPDATWATFKALVVGSTIVEESKIMGLHHRTVYRRQHTALATLAGQATRRRVAVCRKTPDGEVCRQAIAVYAIGLDTDEA